MNPKAALCLYLFPIRNSRSWRRVIIQMGTMLCLLPALNLYIGTSRAQGTAFTYQGQLGDGGVPASGSYDFTFAIFDSCTNGTEQGPILTNTATAVNNGLFLVTLDFGNQFPGANRWLQIAVCTNGAGNFVPLNPRQLLAPAPYAVAAGTIAAGGLPAGTYTNAIIFNNAANQFSGNGAGMTNLAFGSFSAAAQTQVTNAASAAAAALQANLTALAAGTVDTNLFALLSSQCLLVAPWTNLPSSLLTNPFYFSPAKGPNYIQLAINSLPSYTDRMHVGGGEIAVAGINYFPNTLVFANSGFDGNIMSYRIYAPAFTTAALVCQTTPCIHVFGYGNGHYLSDTAFEMDNLIISTVQNTTAILFNLDLNVTDSDVQHCWFGYWGYLTNQINVGDFEGLATPNTGAGITKNDLVVAYTPGSTDRHVFRYNHLTGIDCLLVDCDHFQCDYNFFMECGGNASMGVRSTDWPVASPVAGSMLSQLSTLFWTGAAVVLGQDQPHRNDTFTDNYCYMCGGGYYTAWPQNNFYSYQDSYEGTDFSALSPPGIQLNMIDSDATADSYTYESDNAFSNDFGIRGAVWLSASQFPFNGNGSSLTGLKAANLVGTVPVGDLPGITTTVSTGTSTFYITNGLIMRVTTP
jgi:hypothetical protein